MNEELTQTEIYQAAGEALLASEVTEEQAEVTEEAKEEAKPAESEPKEEQETQEAKAEEKQAEKEEKEEVQEPKKDTPDWRWKKLRDREAKAKQALVETQSMKNEYLKKETELKEILQDLIENPAEAFRALAERAGADPNEAYRKLVRSKLMAQDDSPQARELRELKSTVSELKKQIRQPQQATEEIPPEKREAVLEAATEEGLRILDNEELMQAYPNLADLDEPELEGRIRYATNWALDNPQIKITFPQLLKQLDSIEEAEVEKKIQRRNARTGNGTSKKPAGDTPNKGIKAKEPSTLTSKDTSQPSAIPVFETDEERYRAAGALI